MKTHEFSINQPCQPAFLELTKLQLVIVYYTSKNIIKELSAPEHVNNTPLKM